MSEKKEVRWDRVALIAIILLIIMITVGWIQYNFGISTAAWALGGIFTTALIAGTAIFVQWLNRTSQVNTADLLHEFGAAQAGSYKVIEQQLRSNRDSMKLEGKMIQWESKQGDRQQYDFVDTEEQYGPVYVD